MRSAARHTRFAACLFLLVFDTFVPHLAGSTPPPARSSRIPGITPQAASDSRSDVARWSAQLKSGDEEERREAAMILSSIEGPAAVAALTDALTDKSPRVRAAAINALSERDGESIARLLIARLAEDKDEFVRKSAGYALAKLRGAERTGALIEALNDKSPEVRGAAAVSLGDHADARAIAPLADALGDKSAFVRAQAARALGVNGISAAQAVSKLINLLNSDPDNEVKRQAATALGRIGDRAALEPLERARRDKDPYLAQAALDAIRQIR
ncbi:MAG TPA: HEAT repeat domain-containing protein [Blastocatellia bacterium]|nr:HEAT repeat domain-containing protein [Blastocatellia bacterium]